MTTTIGRCPTYEVVGNSMGLPSGNFVNGKEVSGCHTGNASLTFENSYGDIFTVEFRINCLHAICARLQAMQALAREHDPALKLTPIATSNVDVSINQDGVLFHFDKGAPTEALFSVSDELRNPIAVAVLGGRR